MIDSLRRDGVCFLKTLWRGAGAAEQARLESACPRKWAVGSNPTLSAKACARRGASGPLIFAIRYSEAEGPPQRPDVRRALGKWC